MGKYAISKLSVILYHKQTNLSIGFAKFLKNIFQIDFESYKRKKKAAIAAYKSRFDSDFFYPMVVIWMLQDSYIKGCRKYWDMLSFLRKNK